MSSLSAHERRILAEIEHHLAAAEPRLEQALVAARVPAFQYWPVVRSSHPALRRNAWVIGMITSLLCGIGLLTAGITIGNFPLIIAGIPLAQFTPLAAGWLSAKRSRSTR
jgi:hypothetical protein